MENKFSKFINLQGKYLTSLLILLALSIGYAWGADPDISFEIPVSGASKGDYFKEWTISSSVKVTLSSTMDLSSNDSHQNISISSNAGNLNANYISICVTTGTSTIDKISILAGGSGNSKGIKAPVIGWTTSYASQTTTANSLDYIEFTSASSGGGKIDNADWREVDLSGTAVQEVRIYKKLSKNQVTIEGETTNVDLGSGETLRIWGIKIWLKAATPATKHSVTYVLGTGASGTTPTQADVAEGSKFTLHDGTTGISAPSGKKFDGWHDGTAKYAGGAEYTMGTSDVTLTAQWVDNLPEPTATFTDGTYIIGCPALNMASKFSSNSSGAVTYSLKEATANASITSAGAFTATVAGTYVVVANQVAVAGTYSAITKEATVTVLDNVLSDTYIWKKGSGYTGCVASPNADAPAAQYTDIAYEGFTKMGRAATDNTECILTFTVKAAYSATFGIKSICTYGKFEEPLGGQISWDGGTSWENLAAYTTEQAKTFNAPAATFPSSFKIKFMGVSKDAGGLWWRNALVTLQVIKTVSSVTEELYNVKVNGTAISAADLATLKSDKSLAIATTYAAAPEVTFVKRSTISYTGGWSSDVVDEDIDVTASDATTNWSASSTINSQAYTVTLAKPAGPTLETETTALTLASAKIATDTKKFTFSGANLEGNVTIALESAVAGMTVSPAEVTPTAGAITDEEVTITYKSLADVAEANVNLIVRYSDDVKIIIPLTYSSTVGYEELTPISAATTWNWDGAADAAIGTVVDKTQMIVLANADATWDAGFNANAIAGKLEHMYRDGKYAQGDELMFKTTIPGKVFVTYSNTGGNAARTVNVNGTKGSLSTAGTGEKRTESFLVSAGDVLIKGVQVSDDAAKYLRFYEVRFAHVYSVEYSAGEGAVKEGESIPTHADEAAGEKITLAAATVLEKSDYDFTGWLCNIDGVTYDAGAEYTMTAAATTFTAQWVEHVDPVDPTLTYDDGAYSIGGAALDLSTLITAQTSTGKITYSVTTDGGTGATIDGKNFTATTAGTATITASQEAVLGYNAKTVDFDVVVTEATEIDGIKLVVAGALTGNFITSATLNEGANTIEGINYPKYIKFGSTFSGSYGNGARNNYLIYDLKKKNTTFHMYVHNNANSAYKIVVYAYNTTSAKATEIEVAANENAIKSFSLNDVTENTRVFIGVNNSNIYFCQVVAVETGDALLQGGQSGYAIDFGAKSRFAAEGSKVITLDGMEYVTSSGYTPNSSTEVALNTLGTNYVKFVLTAQTEVQVTTNTTNKYFIGSSYDAEQATSKTYENTPTATKQMYSITLDAGTWYLNPNGSNIKLTRLAFQAPKCEQPTVTDLADVSLCTSDAYTALTVNASVNDGGTLYYQWFKENGDTDEAVGTDDKSFTPTADGQYYVVVTNQLADHSDNSKTSNTITVKHFASAEITKAPENKRDEVGKSVTLTVEAEGKGIEYKWYTCDDETGANPVAITPAETNASLTVTVAAGTQWYKVVVSSDCGNDEAVAKVSEFTATTPANVTESIVWDWTSSAWPASGTIEFTDKVSDGTDLSKEYELLADADPNVPNNDGFRSDMLYGKGQYVWRSSNKFFQGTALKFTSTVAGVVRVNFRSTGNNKHVQVAINGTVAGAYETGNFRWSEYVEVPAGNVEIICLSTDNEKAFTRISKVEFLALGNSRDVTIGDLGTVCLPNKCIARGVEVYELQGKEPTYGKIVFDELGKDEFLGAGKAYIFQVKEATARFYFTADAAVTTPDASSALRGNLDAEPITFAPNSDEAKNVYFVKEHAFWAAKETGVKINQYRAYLQMDEVGTASPSPAPGRKRIALGVQGEQVATALDNLNADDAPRKVMIDGQLFILRGEQMFDATGRLVK